MCDYGEREITVEVSTDGPGPPAPAGAPPAGAGGAWPGCANGSTCSAASSARAGEPDGGFVVRARIPTGSPA